jgi:hypothetical protein
MPAAIRAACSLLRTGAARSLLEAVAHGALADNRALGVHVDGRLAGDDEVPRLDVLHVVDRQRVQALVVGGQHPVEQEAAS